VEQVPRAGTGGTGALLAAVQQGRKSRRVNHDRALAVNPLRLARPGVPQGDSAGLTDARGRGRG